VKQPCPTHVPYVKGTVVTDTRVELKESDQTQQPEQQQQQTQLTTTSTTTMTKRQQRLKVSSDYPLTRSHVKARDRDADVSTGTSETGTKGVEGDIGVCNSPKSFALKSADVPAALPKAGKKPSTTSSPSKRRNQQHPHRPDNKAPPSSSPAVAAAKALYHFFNANRISANTKDEEELRTTIDPKRRKLLQNRMALRRLRIRRSTETGELRERLRVLRRENGALKEEQRANEAEIRRYNKEAQRFCQ
jgi:hypothetical protein